MISAWCSTSLFNLTTSSWAVCSSSWAAFRSPWTTSSSFWTFFSSSVFSEFSNAFGGGVTVALIATSWWQRSCELGRSFSLYSRQQTAMLSRGWEGSTQSIWALRRSFSGIGTWTGTGPYFSSITSLLGGPGFGNSRVMIWMVSTPKEKISSFSVYSGGDTRACGGMYTRQPGHCVWFSAACLKTSCMSLAIPKSVTLALRPAVSNTLLLERSRWMMPFKWR